MNPLTCNSQGIPTPTPRVGVVIVTWNKKEHILSLLDDLAAHSYPNWTVLVVDNCSADGTVEAIGRNHPWVRVLPLPHNLGGSGGFNAGLRAMLQEGGYDYVWLLDNDVSLEPGALDVLIEALEARPDAGVAGSHIIQMDHDGVTNEIGGDVDLTRGRLLLRRHGSLARFHRQEVYEVDYVAACSLLVRFAVLSQVGLWDNLFIHYDDVDWCLRIRGAGHRVLACAASRIRHMSARVKPVTWILYYDIRNLLYLQRKHQVFRPLRELHFLALLLYFSMHDELSGKGYYAILIEQAVRDFLAGRMGKCTRLPALELKPTKDELNRLLHGPPGTILVLEPTRNPVFAGDDIATAASRGIHVAGVCHKSDMRCTAIPADAQRVRLSGRRWIMAAQLLARILFQRRADYLVLDIDQPCGLLGLCAKRILLLVDDKCYDTQGGYGRLPAALKWPILWIPILLRWLVSAPPLAWMLATARTCRHAMRRWPWRFFPGIVLWYRLRRWPLIRRIEVTQANLGCAKECIPPFPRSTADEARKPQFHASTAKELKDALHSASVSGGDILLEAARIEFREPLRLPSGVRLVGKHDQTILVFNEVAFGVVICGNPDRSIDDCSIHNVTICHASTLGGFSAAVLIAQAHDITIDHVRVDSPCGIGVLTSDGAERISLTNCDVRNGGQDGVLLLRRVVDFSMVSCNISGNRQSGILICDWRLPQGMSALDFDEQIRCRIGHAVAYDPADPCPFRIRLQECDISKNRRMGICTDGAGELAVNNCRVHDNECEGITLDNGTWHARVLRCEIWGNGNRARQSEEEFSSDFVVSDDRLPDGSSAVKLPGISMDNAALCRVEDSIICGNYGDGIKFVRAAYRCVVKGNTIADNNRGSSSGHPHHGIRVGADPAQHPGQYDFPSSDNDILDNQITGGHDCGVLLNAGTCHNRVKGNIIAGTLGYPIRAWSWHANNIG
jgi:GT2 family glycosyltransferase